MNVSNWASAKHLLADVADQPPAEQRAYIEQRCTDPTLFREPLAMLELLASVSQTVAAVVMVARGADVGCPSSS